MTRIRRRRFARILLVLSALLGVGVVGSLLVNVVIGAPGGLVGMLRGVYVVQLHGAAKWMFVCSFDDVGWDAKFAVLPKVTVQAVLWELSVPVWLPFFVCVVMTFVAYRLSRLPPGHCANCDYDLTGNVSGRCPECGEAVSLGDTSTHPERIEDAGGG